MKNSLFQKKIEVDLRSRHIVQEYKSVKSLYGFLCFSLTINVYNSVYVNEGGHIRYVKLLAKLFPKKVFYVHIRLLEDTNKGRLGTLPPNVKLISVSRFITEKLNDNGYAATTIHDLYVPVCGDEAPSKNDKLRDEIAIVGRLTDTKGIDAITEFCRYADKHSVRQLVFNFFGDVNKDSAKVQAFIKMTESFKNIRCRFHGFVNDKAQIYNSCGKLLHFNTLESLGRIALESIDYGTPFIGFTDGGIGEIAEELNLTAYMVNPSKKDWCADMLAMIDKCETPEAAHAYAKARRLLLEKFSAQTYTQLLEKLFHI